MIAIFAIMALPLPAGQTSARRRILLVEDDDGVRRSLHLMLHGRGYDVRSYSAAVPLMAEAGYFDADCLIADYRLIDTDGFSVLTTLRDAGWAGRSILITAWSDPQVRLEARTCGYDMVLEKPVRPHDLIAAIEGPR